MYPLEHARLFLDKVSKSRRSAGSRPTFRASEMYLGTQIPIMYLAHAATVGT